MFKRRDKPGFWVRTREFLTPRKGWRRGFEYVGRRVQRLPDTPHRIALGLACGMMASFTPLFGLHFFLAMAMAWFVGGNILSSAFGTFLGNPLTFPFIAGVSLWVGSAITGEAASPAILRHGAVFDHFRQFLDTLFLPYLIGGVLPGLICSAIVYWLARGLVAAYQRRRRNKLIDRARRRMAEHLAARRRETDTRRIAEQGNDHDAQASAGS